MLNAVDRRPIFVLGRQHSGNTMLAMALGRHDAIFASIGESLLLEHADSIGRLEPGQRAREIAAQVRQSTQPPLDDETTEALEAVLARKLAEDPGAGVGGLMDAAMHHLGEAQGKRRWAQKATSYIFYVDTILAELPGAQMLYLSRNPFDIGASLKRRGDGKVMVRATIAWNRGVKRALACREAYPDRFQVVCYEKLVTEGEEVFREIMAFLGEEFQTAQLEIPHVNRSEKKYTLESSSRGLSSSRVCYYPSVLTTEEIQLIHHYVDHDLLAQVYPDLAAEIKGLGAPSLMARARSFSSGVAGVVGRTAALMRHDPRVAYDRIVRRLGA